MPLVFPSGNGVALRQKTGVARLAVSPLQGKQKVLASKRHVAQSTTTTTATATATPDTLCVRVEHPFAFSRTAFSHGGRYQAYPHSCWSTGVESRFELAWEGLSFELLQETTLCWKVVDSRRCVHLETFDGGLTWGYVSEVPLQHVALCTPPSGHIGVLHLAYDAVVVVQTSRIDLKTVHSGAELTATYAAPCTGQFSVESSAVDYAVRITGCQGVLLQADRVEGIVGWVLSMVAVQTPRVSEGEVSPADLMMEVEGGEAEGGGVGGEAVQPRRRVCVESPDNINVDVRGGCAYIDATNRPFLSGWYRRASHDDTPTRFQSRCNNLGSWRYKLSSLRKAGAETHSSASDVIGGYCSNITVFCQPHEVEWCAPAGAEAEAEFPHVVKVSEQHDRLLFDPQTLRRMADAIIAVHTKKNDYTGWDNHKGKQEVRGGRQEKRPSVKGVKRQWVGVLDHSPDEEVRAGGGSSVRSVQYTRRHSESIERHVSVQDEVSEYLTASADDAHSPQASFTPSSAVDGFNDSSSDQNSDGHSSGSEQAEMERMLAERRAVPSLLSLRHSVPLELYLHSLRRDSATAPCLQDSFRTAVQGLSAQQTSFACVNLFCAVWSTLVAEVQRKKPSAHCVAIKVPTKELHGRTGPFGFALPMKGLLVGDEAVEAFVARQRVAVAEGMSLLVVQGAVHFAEIRVEGDVDTNTALPTREVVTSPFVILEVTSKSRSFVGVHYAKEVGVVRRDNDVFFQDCEEQTQKLVGLRCAGALRRQVLTAFRNFDDASRDLENFYSIYSANERLLKATGQRGMKTRVYIDSYRDAFLQLGASFSAWRRVGGGDVEWSSLSAAQIISTHEEVGRLDTPPQHSHSHSHEHAHDTERSTQSLALAAMRRLHKHSKYIQKRCYYRTAVLSNTLLNSLELCLRNARVMLCVWVSLTRCKPRLKAWLCRARKRIAAAGIIEVLKANQYRFKVANGIVIMKKQRKASYVLQRAGRACSVRKDFSRRAHFLRETQESNNWLARRYFALLMALRLWRRCERVALLQVCLRVVCSSKVVAWKRVVLHKTLFLQAQVRVKLLRRRRDELSAVVRIQRQFRLFLCTKRRQSRAAALIQATYRCCRQRGTYLRTQYLIRLIQSTWRMHMVLSTRPSLHLIKSRAAAASLAAANHERHVASCMIVAFCKKCCLFDRFHLLTSAVLHKDRTRRTVLLQASARSKLSVVVWRVHKQRASHILTAQSTCRAGIRRIRRTKHNAAVLIQRHVMRFLLRRRAKRALLGRRQQRRDEDLHDLQVCSVVLIQSIVRAYFAQKRFRQRLASHRAAQRILSDGSQRLEAVVAIQRKWKMCCIYNVMKRLHLVKVNAAAARIQRKWRAKKEQGAALEILSRLADSRKRREMIENHHAAIIQTFWRCYKDV